MFGVRWKSNVDMGLINGAHALMDGFGEAPPAQEVAQARADVCRFSGRDNEGKPCGCPHNHLGGWNFTAKMAAAIHVQRERKLQLRLRVEGEEQLGMCKLCGCFLPLKVFWSEEGIYSHTSDQDFAKFAAAWPQCWMNEIKQHHSAA